MGNNEFNTGDWGGGGPGGNHATETGISSGPGSHFARMQIFSVVP